MLKTPTGFALRQPQVVLQRTSNTPNVVLTSDSSSNTNGVRILTDVGGLNGLTGKVQFVSGSTVQDHNRVQIVTGVQNPNTMSLTEQQRVQIVTAGVPDMGSMSLTTEQQNHLQILASVPNATTEVSLTEQQQNRMEIISNVPSGTTTVNEQKNRIQVIPSSRTVSLTEQLVSDISQQILTNVPTSSNIHEQNTRVIFQNTNTERNNEHNSLHISSSERTDVHITSSSLPESQTKLHMIANLPQTCSISLNEQNRYQIIPNSDYTFDEKSQQNVLDGQKLVNAAEHIHLNDQRMQMSSESDHSSVSQQTNQRLTHLNENQGRFHVISNVEEQQRFMQVNEEQNRIIVSSSIEHQRVLNASAVSFNEQQNRVQMVSNGSAEQQRLLQQLSEEQRKIQIFANLPPQQRVMQLNEHQKLTVKTVENMQEQLQAQQKLPTSVGQTMSQHQHHISKVNYVHVKDNTYKLNPTPGIDIKLTSEFQEKLPDINNLNSDHLRNDSVGVQCEDTNTLGSQYLLNGKISSDNSNAMKSRCNNSFDSRGTTNTNHISNINGNVHQTYKSNARSNIACSPSSVISPRCTPSPHSPHFSNKSPSHHSPQSPIVSTQNIINSCFSNRPNLTVVTQSSPPSLTNQNQIDQNAGLPQLQVKPCAAVISHSNVHISNNVLMSTSQSNSIDHHGIKSNVSFLSNASDCCNERFVAPSLSSPSQTTSPPLQNNMSPRSVQQSISPPVTNQNSFLDTIVQSHPNISINKTGIVQPCSKPNVMRGKKPKKSAVVKPMVFQPEDKDKSNDGPACLNPVFSNDGSHSSVVQRVQTIQLTPQKQQVSFCFVHYFFFFDTRVCVYYSRYFV